MGLVNTRSLGKATGSKNSVMESRQSTLPFRPLVNDSLEVTREYEVQGVPMHKSCESKWETSQVFKLFLGRMIYST